MSIHLARFTLVALAVGSGAAAMAAEPAAAVGPAASFAALDVNHDGVVSQYEYDGDVAFALMDADHDKRLSVDELQAFVGEPAAGAPTVAERIVLADVDADGSLDENELRNAVEMRYGWMDRNGDGNLDQAEFAAAFGVRVR